MSALLTIQDLVVRFRTKGLLRSLVQPDTPSHIQAVNGVSLEIAAGEVFGLVGESGSGKTTLARSVIGLVPCSSGSIVFDGHEVAGKKASGSTQYRRQMAMMFQDPVGCLSPRLTVASLIAQPFRIHGERPPDMRKKITELLSVVGLPAEFASRYPHQLSGGQARRVGLARALALSPKLILADEPTAGLDVSIQGDVLNLLGKTQQEYGVSILAITHNLSVIRHISDRMAIMYMGSFVEMGPTEEVFARPRHPYTQALLSANPVPDPDAQTKRIDLEGEIPSLLNRPRGCEFHTRCPLKKDRCCHDAPEPVVDAAGHMVCCHSPLDSRGI